MSSETVVRKIAVVYNTYWHRKNDKIKKFTAKLIRTDQNHTGNITCCETKFSPLERSEVWLCYVLFVFFNITFVLTIVKVLKKITLKKSWTQNNNNVFRTSDIEKIKTAQSRFSSFLRQNFRFIIIMNVARMIQSRANQFLRKIYSWCSILVKPYIISMVELVYTHDLKLPIHNAVIINVVYRIELRILRIL